MIDRNDIVGLAHRSYGTAAALAVAEVPAQRVKEWLKRGVLDVTDPGGRGAGNRRRFQLLDILQIRLTAALTDDDTGLSLSLPAARAVLQSALYGRDAGIDAHRASVQRLNLGRGDLYGMDDYAAEAESFALQTERVFMARWLIAARVRYAEPDITFWQAHLSEWDTLADALMWPIPNPRNEPQRLLAMEIRPHAEAVVSALLDLGDEG
jgi:hypothetical protein